MWELRGFLLSRGMALSSGINPLQPGVAFYTLWKDQKTFRFSDVFRGYRKATLNCNGLNELTFNENFNFTFCLWKFLPTFWGSFIWYVHKIFRKTDIFYLLIRTRVSFRKILCTYYMNVWSLARRIKTKSIPVETNIGDVNLKLLEAIEKPRKMVKSNKRLHTYSKVISEEVVL